MNFLLQVSLLIVVMLIVGFAFWRLTGRHRKRRARKGHHAGKAALKQRRGMFWRRDHGAHVARRHGHERSPQWHRVQKEHLRREPVCVACGYKGRKLQVHHIKPFHLHPHLELDPSNLVTLCQARGRNHHLLLGHLDQWESYNEHVRDDARRFYRKTAAQIRADSTWQKKVLRRP